jgi:TatD DNase family protein
MIGLHPTSVKKYYRIGAGKLRNLAANFKFIAIGEIGIDLYWDTEFISQQIEALRNRFHLLLNQNCLL